MKYKLGIILSLIIISCQNETSIKKNTNEIAQEKMLNAEITEEGVLKIKADKYLDAGTTIEEIINN